MARNKIEDLRNHLFETIEKLKDGDKGMDMEKAQTIANVAQVIVNSAKVEVDYMRAQDKVNGIYNTTGFMESSPRPAPQLHAKKSA